jgi:hypothetical protein
MNDHANALTHRWIIGALLLIQLAPVRADDRVVAHYLDFGISRMTGIPEAQIASYACEYRVERARIDELIVRAPPAVPSSYEGRDVRAMFRIGERVMYVDSSGGARLGTKYFRMRKSDVAEVFRSGMLVKCGH